MLRRFSIDELQRKGVRIDAAEAVAIAQQLIRAPHTAGSAAPPFGPPAPANVFLARDGSVTCAGGDATWAVSEIAILLQELLPPGTANVPGSLRYTVARALLEVDAPPFDSLEDFSRALARHERGSRADLIRGVLDRVAGQGIDRRQTDPAVADLRRQLRDADARIYDQQLALDALAAMTPAVPRGGTRRLALAAGIFVGITLVGAGESMRQTQRPPQPSIVVAPHVDRQQRAPLGLDTAALSGDLQRVREAETLALQPAIQAGVQPLRVSPQPKPVSVSAAERPVVKRAARTTPPPRERARRSKFQWWRTKFTLRADPL